MNLQIVMTKMKVLDQNKIQAKTRIMKNNFKRKEKQWLKKKKD